MVELAFYAAGAALIAMVGMTIVMTIVILGLQWLITFPFRLGWREHAGPIGKVTPAAEKQ